MTITRREFAKLSSFAAAITFLPFSLIGCGIDAVIAALNVAAAVASSAEGILKPISAKLANVLHLVSSDLLTVVRLYHEYDSAPASGKPSKFTEIQNVLSTITNNLSEILSAIHVFNPGLQTVIKTAVAIVNTAISLIISHLPAQHKTQMQAMRLNLPSLPIIDGAKNAHDLKAKWNETVAAEHPEAVIK